MSTMIGRRKPHHDKREEKHRGWFERIIFSFMGPPQLGDHGTPVRQPAQVDRCTRCGRPWDEHEVVRVATHSFTRCPSS